MNSAPKRFTLGRPHWWQWLTVLSLDAVPVALVWQALFAEVLRVECAWYQYVLLGLAVWIIYIADRWIEGWRLSTEAVQTHRHHFYIVRRWPIFFLGLAIIPGALGLAAARLPRLEWAAFALLIISTLIYLLSHQLAHRHHPLRVPKELCIAALFPLGTSLAPAVIAIGNPSPFTLAAMLSPLAPLLVPLCLFGLLCLTNLALISVWETEVDKRHGQTSLALQFSRRLNLIHALPWLVAFIGLAAAAGTHGATRTAGLCATGSAILLGCLDRAEPFIGRQAARALVDLTLLTPAAMLFCR